MCIYIYIYGKKNANKIGLFSWWDPWHTIHSSQALIPTARCVSMVPGSLLRSRGEVLVNVTCGSWIDMGHIH